MEQRDTPEQFGEDPAGICRRWLTELDFAAKRDKDWLKLGQKVIDLYRGKGRKKNSFNILYSNTETIASAVYNAPPKPDVRRRFKDADPVGKVVSKMLERSLEFSIDSDSFAQSLTHDVMDMLLPGRGLSRVRYVPSLVPQANGQEDESAESQADEAGETEEMEEVAWEQVVLDHVQWDDFRTGPGKTWQQVMWIGFRHRLCRDELVDKFGDEIGNAIPLDDTEEDERKTKDIEVFKTAEVWEIWDKDDRKVRFVCAGYKAKCCLTVDDPMSLMGFYPVPRPLYAICDATTLEVLPLFEQYREQAGELDRISTRINKLIDALRVRGVYDSTMAELSELMRGEDNDLIPAQNVSAWIERGGLEKAIWMMPIEGPAKVLQVLYQQRDASKQVIYEITGIADVMRGASDANETLGAQQLKAKWGGQRISRLQAEVQRYARDQIRIMAEIIGEKFQPDTLMKMTGLKLPTNQDVQMMQMQAQMQAQQFQQQQAQQPPGQQPPAPPPPFQPPEATIEQVMEVMRDDLQRSFRIDVETDSMIAAAQQAEAEEIRALVQGLSEMFNGLGPAVQSGALPVESAKEIMLAVTRRAKMGSAVEDALDKMQAPQQQDPNAAKAQADAQAQQAQQAHDAQIEQARMQHEAQLEQMKGQQTAQLEQMRAQLADQQHQRELEANQQASEVEAQRTLALEQQKQQMQAQQVQHQNEIEAQRELQRQQLEAAQSEREAAYKAQCDSDRLDYERWKTQLDNETKVLVAQIAVEGSMRQSALSAQTAPTDAGEAKESTDTNAALTAALEGFREAVTNMRAPRSVVRDESGRISGVV